MPVEPVEQDCSGCFCLQAPAADPVDPYESIDFSFVSGGNSSDDENSSAQWTHDDQNFACVHVQGYFVAIPLNCSLHGGDSDLRQKTFDVE